MDTLYGPKSLKLLDDEIERLTIKLSEIDPLSDDYETIVNRITALTEARGKKNERAISTDTLLTVAANIVGLVMILNYERLNVISTKALTMVLRK